MERIAEIAIRSCPILIGAILLTWFFFLVTQARHLENHKSILEEQQFFLSKVERPYIEMMRWEQFLRDADVSAALTSQLLLIVSGSIPKNVVISKTNINRESGSMLIHGTVHGDAKKRAITMAEFSKSLTDSGFFSNVKASIMKATTESNVEGRFRLNSSLRKVR